ncbi:MAG: GHKL domain-containing protein [Nitrospirae bacterium]|nr:GHKL domain-containing protein [Nitrospirota bacterium]
MIMLNIPVPYERLLQFQESLGLTGDSLNQLDPYRELFIAKKDEFAAHFHRVFEGIPEAKLVLDYEEKPGLMLRIWSNWFERIFRAKLDRDLYAYLWRIGLRHVEVNLDQRYSNLGFSIIRQFCHKIVLSDVEHGSRTSILRLIDDIMDLCLLVETSAYIEATTRCDIEIIKGIADRVRNPVTVIGGGIKRLQKKVEADSPAFGVYESLLSENNRLEHMVTDIKMYFEMFQEEPVFHSLELEPIIRKTSERLKENGKFAAVKLETAISPDAAGIMADARDMECMFYHLLQNSFEAVDPKDPRVRISTRTVTEPHPGILIEVSNTGKPIREEDLDKFASPFFSTKPAGTGFGIPIIRLAVRKNHGKVVFLPARDEGMIVMITLPPTP